MKRLAAGIVAAAALAVLAAPGQTQSMSDSFNFLKAVRERDGAKVSSIIATPGSVAINAKDRSTGDSGLHMVVRDRDLTWLAYLLGKGAKIDSQNGEGLTPLTLAAQLGWAEGAELLLRRGASVDLPNNRGETPLIYAVHRRDLAMVRLLVDSGANPKRSDNVAGYSALDYAKKDQRSAAIVKLLETPVKTKEVAGPVR